MEELYKDWLRGLVSEPGLFSDLFFEISWETKFTCLVPNDRNRASDGTLLRYLFYIDMGFDNTEEPVPDFGECRIIELLIGVARRMNDILYDNVYPDLTGSYFHELLQNLGFFDYDEIFTDDSELIEETYYYLNNREYNFDGSGGGLFPIKAPSQDQRQVEIWYQMQEYLSERV